MLLLDTDVMRLLAPIPYLQLGRPNSAKTYISKLIRDGTELKAMLASFPDILYEPLDQHYTLLRCLGSLSEALVHDLCFHHTWRGVVWAAFLVALVPDPRYKQYLVTTNVPSPTNQWLVDLAIAEVDHTIWHEDPELQTLVHRLRALLFLAPRKRIELRRFPTQKEIKQLDLERERVKSIYKSSGFQAARAEFLRTKVLRTLSGHE